MSRWTAPFVERNGRFSPLKSAAFVGLFLPAAWIVGSALTGALDPKPVTEMIHQTGDWAIRLLLVSLAITPLRRVTQWSKWIALRRMIGVSAFAYAIAHICLYVVDQKFDLPHVASEIALRFYLTIGFVALAGLGLLAATSTDAQIKRLGAARWNRLHKAVYGIAIVALLHYYIQAKLDISDPVLLTGFYVYLMLFRLAKTRSVNATLGLATVIAPLVAGLAEASWYAVVRHISFLMVIEANFSLEDDLRPAVKVAVAAVAILVGRLGWPLLRSGRLPILSPAK